jgi:hypothetical protein
MIVVIDDLRTLKFNTNTVVHCRTSEQGISFLKMIARERASGIGIDALFLDHDLGGDDTIRPVVTWLEEAIYNATYPVIAAIYAHTANPVGADYITKSRLLTSTYFVQRIGLEMFDAHQ